MDIFDCALSAEDHEKIGRILQRRLMLRLEFVTAHGPLKFLEEDVWDGEI